MNPAAAYHAGAVRNGETAESVRKNLVGDTLSKPWGRRSFFIYGQLPGIHKTVAPVTGAVQNAAGAVIPPKPKVVPDQIRLLRNGEFCGKTGSLSLKGGPGKFHLLLVSGKFSAKNNRAVGKTLGGQGTAAKSYGPAAGHGAEGRLTEAVAGIKNKRFAHEKTPRFKMEGETRRRAIIKMSKCAREERANSF